jgi:moderate conductance mechanosensitive channel
MTSPTPPSFPPNAILSLPVNPMSSALLHWPQSTLPHVLRLTGIFLIALILNRILRLTTNLLIKRAGGQARAAQIREQQTRTLATVVYSAGNKVVWAIALLTALPEFGINIAPVAALAGLTSLALGFGAQDLVRDVISGFYIVFEDQYTVGDTIQVGSALGRVEHLTLRRTVLRDPAGGLVTIGNGKIRIVSNLSRDWSQTFVDVTLSAEHPVGRVLEAFENAAGGLRSDPAWASALVDGPRVLGVQSFDRNGSTIRLQVRTAPTRQDEVARELRRRIQIEFQKQAIPLADVQRVEWKAASDTQPEIAPPAGNRPE